MNFPQDRDVDGDVDIASWETSPDKINMTSYKLKGDMILSLSLILIYSL